MSKKLSAGAIAAVLAVAPAAAQTTTFDAGNEGWQYGSMDTVANIFGPATWNPAGYLEQGDDAGEMAFFAPAAYLGDRSALYGSTISYDTGDTANDGVVYAAMVLYGAGTAISIGSLPPATVGTSHFSFTLTEAGFDTYAGAGIQQNSPVDQATFQSVLANLTAIAIHADWNTGGDDTVVDNVQLGTAAATVPEPASWAMMVAGFGLLGGALRRRTTAARFA